MPVGAIISGAAALGSAVAGAISNRKADERANQYAIDAQNRANQQNIEFWNLQNEYNSPSAQMERLRAAGLNPNLIYGTSPSSAVGNAGDIGKAAPAPTRATSQAAEISRGISAMMAFADWKQKEAQTDNLRAQNAVMMQQLMNSKIDYNQKLFDLQFAQQARPERMNREHWTTMKSMSDSNSAMSESGIKHNEGLVSDATYQARINRINAESKFAESRLKGEDLLNRLKELDIELRELGFTPQDQLWQRMLGRLIQKVGKRFNVNF